MMHLDKDVLLEDLNKLTNTKIDDSKEAVSENRAKQYLIFIINRWGKAKPLKYVVARYVVGSGVSSVLLLSEIPKIISGLYSFGIIVNNVTADGASENRSSFCALSTITMNKILQKNSSLNLTAKQKSILTLVEYKVAFEHPIQDDIIICIGREIPPLIKEIVNAFERSGSVKSTDLHFRSQQITLQMLQQLWLCEQGESKVGSLRINFLAGDRWPLRTSFHRMRVFLATQVVSATLLRLIDNYAAKCGGIEIYAPIRVLVANIDRLVDICNNTRVNNRGVVKGCEEIDSQHHFHLKELINILEIFAEWTSEAKTKVAFIPWQSYEDLILLITTNIGIATIYLKEDKIRPMVQRHGGSDNTSLGG